MNRSISIAGKIINDNSRPFVIAEIGHNHGGSLNHCKKLITLAAECGCDAVKLQKRNNKRLYTKTYYAKPYDNPHSYGKTYGEHREALEFDREQYLELQRLAGTLGLIFFATPFDPDSVDFLASIGVPCFKIASGDLTNTPLIEYIASCGRPVIISTGGANYGDINRATRILMEHDIDFAILHCVASYPNHAIELNLDTIRILKNIYPDQVIGFSSHYDGILAGVSAWHYGAQIIEYHFTDSHANKGTDHALSLQPQGMSELIHYLREAHEMRGVSKNRQIREKEPLKKMEKSIYPARELSPGETVSESDIIFRSPGGGLYPYEAYKIDGWTITATCSTAEPLTWDKITPKKEG